MINTLKSLYEKIIENKSDSHSRNDIIENKVPGIISNISIQGTKSVNITLLTEQIPGCEDLIYFEELLENELNISEVVICPLSFEVSDFSSLFPWVLRHFSKEKFLLSVMFQNALYKISSENQIEITLPEGMDKVEVETGCKYFKRFFKEKLGKDIEFVLDYIQPDDSQNDHRDKIISEIIEKNRRTEKTEIGDSEKTEKFTGQKTKNNDTEKLGKSKAAEKIAREKPVKNKDKKKDFQYTKKPKDVIWGRFNPEIKLVKMDSFTNETGIATFEGYVFSYESRPVSDGTSILVKFCITDTTNSIRCSAFMKPEEAFDFEASYKKAFIRVQGQVAYDAQYEKDLVAKIFGIQKAVPPVLKLDNADVKRVELHAHTKMSSKDAVCEVSELIRRAADYGHEAIAITDHGVVQSFPNARSEHKKQKAKGKNIKIIYGMECYLAEDGKTIAYMTDEATFDNGFISISLKISCNNKNERTVSKFVAFLFEKDDENRFYPTDFISEDLNSTESEGFYPERLEVFSKLEKFIAGRPLVCDKIVEFVEYLRYEGFRTQFDYDPKIKFFQPCIDTAKIKEYIYNGEEIPGIESFEHIKKSAIQKFDADEKFMDLYEKAIKSGFDMAGTIKDKNLERLCQLNEISGQLPPEVFLHDRNSQYHCIILAKDLVGLYGIYRMVSHSHLKYVFRERPRIPRSMLEFFKSGCIIGSACEAGELFEGIMEHYDKCEQDYNLAVETLKDSQALNISKFYDYLEIQPVGNNSFMLRTGERKGEIISARYKSEQDLKNLNKLVYKLGQMVGKPVCATCDVHFLEAKDSIYREIMQDDIGFSDAGKQPPLFFRTTEEMVKEFEYLGKNQSLEVVISNPKKISDLINDDIKPFPEGTFPPVISTAASDVENLTWENAKKMYCKDGKIPEIVSLRIEKELKSIIGNGFAVMYYIAHKLVKKSNEDGYIVGSRGSVGSSFVATLCNITEVNPMPPHYYCPVCCYSEFFLNDEYHSGYDLPEKPCPDCGTVLIGEGQDIPFETFLGFDGDKQPDIDLNFSGEYQMHAHKYTEEMFGSDHTFRAGTISGYAEKNAIAMVNKYCFKSGVPVTKAESLRLSMGLIGVKRTTGQHPGGIVVVPKDRDIYEFTPVQCPADKTENAIITTHFDFNSLHDTILKLDILGHDDPTMLKVLGDMTGVDVLKIPVTDPKVMQLFTSVDPLEFAAPSGNDCATLGLPELGTFMARGMIKDTRPSKFYDLVQLMGLSHGTDVWKGNAQELIKSNTCSVQDVIGCRDSIMTTLMHHGMEPKEAFNIMEKVRKGKGLTTIQEELMRTCKVPDWYIDSCKKIKYMFPKAHAAAYSISALRIAWFKVYKKEEYYCAFFTVRADEFDARIMCKGFEILKHYLNIFREHTRSKEKLIVKINGKEEEFSPDKSIKIFYILELIEEMYCRGVEFLPVDIYNSHATKFVKEEDNKIRPPLNKLPSLSSNVACNIVLARENAEKFISREDFAKKSGLGDSVLKMLEMQGCLDDLPETTQIDLFSLIN